MTLTAYQLSYTHREAYLRCVQCIKYDNMFIDSFCLFLFSLKLPGIICPYMKHSNHPYIYSSFILLHIGAYIYVYKKIHWMNALYLVHSSYFI